MNKKILLLSITLLLILFKIQAISYYPNQMEFSPIFGRDAVDGVVRISHPGNYRIAQNLNARIIIAADEVSLDLNTREVICDQINENIITVTSGAHHINIFNGHVTCSSDEQGVGSGILVEEDVSSVYIKKIKVFNCGTGIKLDGSDGKEVLGCYVALCDLVSNTTGLSLSYADENVIRECRAIKNKQIGYEIYNGEANYFYACQSLKTEGDGPAAAFRCESGDSNLFEKCAAKKTKTTAVDFGSTAYGFMLTGTESRTKIINCIVNGTDAVETVSATAYGIILEPTLLDAEEIFAEIDSTSLLATPSACVWSPNTQYCATVDENNTLSLFHFNGTSCAPINTETSATANLNDLAWSPDGRLIVTGDDNNTVHVVYFDGYLATEQDSDSSAGAAITTLDWSPDGRFFVAGDAQDTLHVFYYSKGTITYVDSDSTAGNALKSVDWSPGGNYIATGDAGNKIRIFSFDGASVAHLTASDDVGQSITSVAWSPNNKYIAVGDASNTVRIMSFDGSVLEEVCTTGDLGSTIKTVGWSPTGRYVSSGDSSGVARIFLFNNTDLVEQQNASISSYELTDMAWSTGGKFIAATDTNNTMTIYKVMDAPTCCLFKYNTVCDSFAYGELLGIGILGGGNNSFIANTCGGSEINFSYGIPNVFYGDHNTPRPFENISMPTVP